MGSFLSVACLLSLDGSLFPMRKLLTEQQEGKVTAREKKEIIKHARIREIYWAVDPLLTGE